MAAARFRRYPARLSMRRAPHHDDTPRVRAGVRAAFVNRFAAAMYRDARQTRTMNHTNARCACWREALAC
jgi:hypothetical protein